MVSPESNTAVLWAARRRLYPLYHTLAREFVIDTQSCADLEDALHTPSAESVVEAEKWFAGMDARIHIHHLRHFAQTSSLMTEQALSDLLLHSLNKKQRTPDDRDKVDFLLVQIFSMRVPSRIADSDLSLDAATKILEPVLGPITGNPPAFMKDLDELVTETNRARNLNALFTSRIIERSREVKLSCGDQFFEPIVMTAFARFGFLIRRSFFGLMQQDLNLTLDGLRELENRGVTTIDCRKAQFSAEEPIARIRMICLSWRVMFQAEYSSGQPLCLLVDLRTAVESALVQTAKAGSAVARTKTAVASAAPGRHGT
jgi:hypothetical protein